MPEYEETLEYTRKVRLGVAAVDSGQLVVMDPSYAAGRSVQRDPGGFYKEAGRVTSASREQGGQLKFDHGGDGLAVAFRSGLGDGLYEVWAYYVDAGAWGERIAKVEIILLAEDDF